MKQKRPINVKVYTRAVVAIMLFTVWTLVGLTGLLLWLAPSGSGSGKEALLFELTKSEWGEVHFWFSVATLAVTVVHLIIDWKALRGVLRYLTSAHRGSSVA